MAISDGKTVYVRGADELKDALASTSGGEVFVLEGGDYGGIAMSESHYAHIDFSKGLTFKAADPVDPPSFSKVITYHVDNLTFDGITFDYGAEPGEMITQDKFRFTGGENITVKNSTFDGDLGEGMSGGWEPFDGYGVGTGLHVTGVDGFTFENNEMYSFFRALYVHNTDNVTVADNDLHSISADGMNFISVNDVMIEDNHIHDFDIPEDSVAHNDFIQFWTNGEKEPTTNVTIRSNILDSGDGLETQSIFIANEAVAYQGAGEEMYYQNIRIEDNFIHNGHQHGIQVGPTKGLTISNNTLLANSDSASGGEVNLPGIGVSEMSEGVTVTKNVAHEVRAEGGSGWSVTDNFIIQNDSPNLDNYVDSLFVNAKAGATGELSDYRALPDSPIVTGGYGASLTRDGDGTAADGYITAEASEGLNKTTYSFDVSDFAGGAFKGAEVTWYFDDGTEATGQSVTHTFAAAGRYDVVAKVEDENGGDITFRKTIEVDSPMALHASTDDLDGSLAALDEIADLRGDVAIVSHDGRDAIALNDGSLAYDTTSDFSGNEEFTLTFDFSMIGQDPDTSARIVEMGGLVTTLAYGRLWVTIRTDTGSHQFSSVALDTSTEDWQSLAVTFSGKTGEARLYLNGEEVGAIDGLEGQIQVANLSNGITLGSAYSNSFDGLIDGVAFLDTALTAEQAKVAAEEGIDNVLPEADNDGQDPVVIDRPDEEEDEPEPVEDALTREDVLEMVTDAGGLVYGFDIPALSADSDGVRTMTSEVSIQTAYDNPALDLNGGVFELDRSADYIKNDAFTVSVNFASDPQTDVHAERLVDLPGGFSITLSGDRIFASITTYEKTHWLVSKDLVMDEDAWHNVTLTFDGVGGEAALYLDGIEIASKSGLEGEVQKGNSSHGLTLGGKWNTSFDGALDDLVFIDEALDEEEVQALADIDADTPPPSFFDSTLDIA